MEQSEEDMRLTRLERERERKGKKGGERGDSEKEEEAWNSGRFLGVAKEKRRDDHEGYHKPHHPFLYPSLIYCSPHVSCLSHLFSIRTAPRLLCTLPLPFSLSSMQNSY